MIKSRRMRWVEHKHTWRREIQDFDGKARRKETIRKTDFR
jgi:hypothetical protein